MRMNPMDGDLFTVKLHAKLLEQQQAKLDKAKADLAAVIDIAEILRDWLAYGHNENDPKLTELATQLELYRVQA